MVESSHGTVALHSADKEVLAGMCYLVKNHTHIKTNCPRQEAGLRAVKCFNLIAVVKLWGKATTNKDLLVPRLPESAFSYVIPGINSNPGILSDS